MADRRKLQEIDRCLKKVTEGVDTFEDIWQKVHNATNTNQKEKYEADLKKEIKKLQRLRDQIKTWMASSEIKDKRSLLENRKLIETQMERFKVVERETKTKAYSKEGLGAAQKLDPAQKEKDEITNWLAISIENLNIQLDQFESEIESLSITLKKKKNDKDKLDRTEELKGWLEKHRYHIKQLETLMRMLDNGTVDVDQIKKIKDDVDYYIESSQDPDFEENEFIYEDLQLEDMQEYLSKARLGSDDESSQRSNSPTSTNSSSPTPSPGLTNHSKSNNEDTSVPLKPVAVRAQSSGTLISTVQNSKGALPCVSRNNSNSSESSVSSSPPLNHHNSHFVASPPPPTTPYAIAAAGNSTSSKEETFHTTHSSSSESNATSNNNNSSCNNSTSSTNSKPSTNCIDAPSLSNGSDTNSNHMDITSSSSSNMFTTAILDQISGSGFSQQLSQSQQQQQSLQNFTSSAISLNSSVHYSTTPSACVDNVIKPPSSAGATTSTVTCSSAASSALYSAAAATGSTAGRSCALQPQNSPPISSCNVIGSGVTQSAINCLLINGPVSPKVSSQIYNLPSLSAVQNSDEPMSSLKSMAEQAVLNAGLDTHIPTSPSPSSEERDAHIPPLLGVAPLGLNPLSKECVTQIRILEAAQRHMPHPSDSERLRQYLPRNPVPTPSYYPNGLNHCDTVEFFQRLSTETLFFVFYYMEGTKAQYLAAKALKKQSWRFHTKYMMWFQRHEEPKTITDEFEQGTYIYFDFEKWGQRKKEGFTFEYRYLEDRDLN
ncbi:hypothetical protein CDAR_429771 [Caerostris darwini]|uniref:CCR4-NOT transcription complex subunit 3 n=1 Tax=Caerostris darwini TaxID=1538125 RepID=A0AAV4VT49_9ARAC|nr:hypothetical protein CDAR_429771 [Caerostris darwini]